MAITKKTEKKTSVKDQASKTTTDKRITKTAKAASTIKEEKKTVKKSDTKTTKTKETAVKKTNTRTSKATAGKTDKKSKKEEIIQIGKNLKSTKKEAPKEKEVLSVARRKAIADSELLIDTIVKSMQEKKAKNIVSLDLQSIVSRVSDHFVICHGTSTTQVNAIADSVEHLVRKNLKIKPWHKEGTENAEWVLIDYCDVVVHIFEQEKREFYDIENLWADAEVMEFDNVE